MKRIVILLASILASVTMMQAQSFYADNGNKLAWQKIYESDMTSTDIVKSLYMSGNYTNIQIIDDSFIAATLIATNVDYEKMGYKRMNLPIYLSNNLLGPARVIVQIKEGKYLVTVNNIALTGKSSSPLEGGYLTDLAIDSKGFTTSFAGPVVIIYDTTLTELTTFEKVEEDW